MANSKEIFNGQPRPKFISVKAARGRMSNFINMDTTDPDMPLPTSEKLESLLNQVREAKPSKKIRGNTRLFSA